MGYYADGYGSIKAKDKESYDSIIKLFNERDPYNPFDYSPCRDNDLEIILSESGKYHEDDTYGFLENIADLISEGEIEYNGEGDDHWIIRFNPETSEWEETNGRVVYDMSEYSDKELLDELSKRGLLNKEMNVGISKGKLSAECNGDPDYPGFSIGYYTEDGDYIDLVLVECKAENNYNTIDVYEYSDITTEDYTRKFSVNVDDIYKALE